MTSPQPATTLARQLFQRPTASEINARIERFKTRRYGGDGSSWTPAQPRPSREADLVIDGDQTADGLGARLAQPADNGPTTQCPKAAALKPPVVYQPEAKHSEVAKHRAIAVPVRVMCVAGDTAAGILLSQLIYWTRHSTNVAGRDGRIFKSASDWQHETGMSWKVQHRARLHLLRDGLIEERKHAMPARLEFRLNLPALADRLGTLANVRVDQQMLQSFSTLMGPTAELLMGRPYLYFSLLATVLPLHAAMLCSRLLLTSRMPGLRLSRALEVEHLASWADTGHSLWSTVRMVRMHRDVWRDQTGLTRDQWQTARRKLREVGVLVERQHNFPRRVDLGVDMHALAKLLREGADRAKQVAPSEPRLSQPAESPDPACSNRPILPPTIARSSLYLHGLKALQPPPPQHAARASDGCRPLAFSGFGWGGGEGYAIAVVSTQQALLTAPPVTGQAKNPGCGGQSNTSRPNGGLAMQSKPEAVSALNTALGASGDAAVVWPAVFSDGDRQQAMRYAALLGSEDLQQVLDEIGWQQAAGRQIRSPVALLRTLCSRVQAGTFAPDGAHRIAAARREADDARPRKAPSVVPTRCPQSPEMPDRRSRPSPELVARLAALKTALGGRRAA